MKGSGGEVYQATFRVAEGGVLEKSLGVTISRRHAPHQSIDERGESVLLVRELRQFGST
jgi:hypothetical protein